MLAEQPGNQPARLPAYRRAAWVRAFDRARAGHVRVYRTPHYGVYHATSATKPGVEYTVQTAGPRWHELVCTCPAGVEGRICLHQAAVAHARRHHVYALR